MKTISTLFVKGSIFGLGGTAHRIGGGTGHYQSSVISTAIGAVGHSGHVAPA